MKTLILFAIAAAITILETKTINDAATRQTNNQACTQTNERTNR